MAVFDINSSYAAKAQAGPAKNTQSAKEASKPSGSPSPLFGGKVETSGNLAHGDSFVRSAPVKAEDQMIKTAFSADNAKIASAEVKSAPQGGVEAAATLASAVGAPAAVAVAVVASTSSSSGGGGSSSGGGGGSSVA